MDMFLAASSQLSTVRQVDSREGEFSRLYPSLSLEARTGVFFITFCFECFMQLCVSSISDVDISLGNLHR